MFLMTSKFSEICKLLRSQIFCQFSINIDRYFEVKDPAKQTTAEPIRLSPRRQTSFALTLLIASNQRSWDKRKKQRKKMRLFSELYLWLLSLLFLWLFFITVQQIYIQSSINKFKATPKKKSLRWTFLLWQHTTTSYKTWKNQFRFLS